MQMTQGRSTSSRRRLAPCTRPQPQWSRYLVKKEHECLDGWRAKVECRSTKKQPLKPPPRVSSDSTPENITLHSCSYVVEIQHWVPICPSKNKMPCLHLGGIAQMTHVGNHVPNATVQSFTTGV